MNDPVRWLTRWCLVSCLVCLGGSNRRAEPARFESLAKVDGGELFL
jgi:hypothetical protein